MSKHKILIADDDPAILESLAIRLRAAGYEVVCTQDGYQAVAMAGKQWPDLLLLDIGMPAGDGFSVQERVWKMAHMQRIPVVYLTGDRSAVLENTARTLGAYTLLHKPFETAELLRVVEEAIAQGAPAPSAAE